MLIGQLPTRDELENNKFLLFASGVTPEGIQTIHNNIVEFVLQDSTQLNIIQTEDPRGIRIQYVNAGEFVKNDNDNE
jgi:hypothetical protein